MSDTKISALSAVTAALAAQELAVNDAGTSKKITIAQIAAYLITRVNGSSGAAGPYMTWQNLTSNSADNTDNTTASVVMTTTGVGAGTWKFKYTLIFQTAAGTTGLAIFANHTGTVGQFATQWLQVDANASASTGVGVTTTVPTGTGGLVSGRSEAANNTVSATSISAGVSGANADILVTFEGIIEVTATGSLELKIRTEVNTSAVRVMADSCLVLEKIE